MNNSILCYCGAAIFFHDCCQKYIDGRENAPTALALMKSRYAAFATHNAEYLLKTTHNSQRKYHAINEILHWATTNEWQKLEIISATENTVEFKAYYLDENKQTQIHYEISTFKQEKGSWFYLDGKYK